MENQTKQLLAVFCSKRGHADKLINCNYYTEHFILDINQLLTRGLVTLRKSKVFTVA